jgi:hypothetical protein
MYTFGNVVLTTWELMQASAVAAAVSLKKRLVIGSGHLLVLFGDVEVYCRFAVLGQGCTYNVGTSTLMEKK